MTETPLARARDLTRDIMADPTLPLLGWTKTVETVVAGGPTVRWAGYALLVTLLWVFAAELQRRADDAADVVEETVDEVTDD